MKINHDTKVEKGAGYIQKTVGFVLILFILSISNSSISKSNEIKATRILQTWCVVDDEWKAGTADTVATNSIDRERERCFQVAQKIYAELAKLPKRKHFQFLMSACMSAPGSYSSGEKIQDEMLRAERGIVRTKRDHCHDQATKMIALVSG
jgi:hypothetical protein